MQLSIKAVRKPVTHMNLITADTTVDVHFHACSHGTVDDLARLLQQGQALFLASPDCAYLVSALQKLKRDGGVNITKVMILGSGSFNEPIMDPTLNSGPEINSFKQYYPATTTKQLAAMIKISEVLGGKYIPTHPLQNENISSNPSDSQTSRTRTTPPIIAQDPDAFAFIDKQTLVFFSGLEPCFQPVFHHWISSGIWPGAMLATYPNPNTLQQQFEPQLCQQISAMWGYYDGFFLSNAVSVDQMGALRRVQDARGCRTFVRGVRVMFCGLTERVCGSGCR